MLSGGSEQVFGVEVKSAVTQTKDPVEQWQIPRDFGEFRQRIQHALKLSPVQYAQLWQATGYALQKAEENWDYPVTKFRDSWVRTFIDDVRSQVWCATYDAHRHKVGERDAAREAAEALTMLHRHFHRYERGGLVS